MFEKIQNLTRAELPYICEKKKAPTPQQWYAVIVSVVLAVLILLFLPALFGSSSILTQFSITLFAVVPIATFCFLSSDSGAGLFKKMTLRRFSQSIGLGIIVFILSIISALLMTQLIDTAPNRGVHGLATMSGSETIEFFIFSIPQLFGEEVITVLPFLAIVYFCHQRFHFTQQKAVLFAWFITAIWFATIHLPAYDWHFLQVFFGVGFARLLLTGIYIVTRNLWASTVAHITNDWLMFSIAALSANT